jgi:hypothetical protein
MILAKGKVPKAGVVKGSVSLQILCPKFIIVLEPVSILVEIAALPSDFSSEIALVVIPYGALVSWTGSLPLKALSLFTSNGLEILEGPELIDSWVVLLVDSLLLVPVLLFVLLLGA